MILHRREVAADGVDAGSGVVQLSAEIPGDSCGVGVSPTTSVGFVGQPGTRRSSACRPEGGRSAAELARG